LQLAFENGKQHRGVGAAAAAALPPALQLVFAYKYEAVGELDAFAELGSLDCTVRECATRGEGVRPVSSLGTAAATRVLACRPARPTGRLGSWMLLPTEHGRLSTFGSNIPTGQSS
jgi:hypothetical protein